MIAGESEATAKGCLPLWAWLVGIPIVLAVGGAIAVRELT